MMNIGCDSEKQTQVNLILFFTRLSLYLQAKFAIIDCDCAGKKKLLFAHLLNFRIVLRR